MTQSEATEHPNYAIRRQWEDEARELYSTFCLRFYEAAEIKPMQGLSAFKWDELPEFMREAWISVAHRAHELYN